MTSLHPSPLLDRPGTVPSPTAPDLAWHYGDPLAEQRAAVRRVGLIDRFTDGLVAVTGPDRITLLHLLGSQQFEGLAAGSAAESLWLSARGHVEHWADAAVLDETVLLRTEPGAAAVLAEYLSSMRFRLQVEVADVTAEFAGFTVVGPGSRGLLMTPPAGGQVSARADGGFVRHINGTAAEAASEGSGEGAAGLDRIDVTVPRPDFAAVVGELITAGATPIGTWAAEALRIAERRPRFGIDTDAKTLPNEVPSWLAHAVSADKGCYRGQETVARISNVGAPPRRLVLLNLDGAAERLPAVGEAVLGADGRTVGRVGAAAYHYEDGPIALALIKRTVAPGLPLVADGIDAMIDPADVVPPGPKLTFDRRQFIDFARR